MKLERTKYIDDVRNDTRRGAVEMEIHESPTGGQFAIDFSYIEKEGLDNVVVFDPFTGKKVILGGPEDN